MRYWTWLIALATCANAAEPLGVGISVSASAGIPAGLAKEEWVGEDAENFPKLSYTGATKDGALTLAPKLTFSSSYGKKPVNYLDLLQKGGPVVPIGYSSEINLSFPALDVKLVNNGKQAVHFSSAVLKVAKSAIDPTPLPFLFSNYDQVQCFELLNDGWDQIDSVQFDFALVEKDPKAAATGELPFHRTFQRVKEHLRISLTEELTQAGLDPKLTAAGKTYLDAKDAVTAIIDKTPESANLDEMPSFQKAEEAVAAASKSMSKLSPKLAGKFEKSCWAYGNLTLAWKDGDASRTQKLTFKTQIMLFPPDGLGAPEPVAGKYEAMLRESGENYELPVDVSRIVKAGGVDRFVVTTGIPRTSRHALKLELKTTEGETISSGPIVIEGLLPRSSGQMLGSSTPEEAH